MDGAQKETVEVAGSFVPLVVRSLVLKLKEVFVELLKLQIDAVMDTQIHQTGATRDSPTKSVPPTHPNATSQETPTSTATLLTLTLWISSIKSQVVSNGTILRSPSKPTQDVLDTQER